MGIPAFYRWLVEKYPLSVIDVLEEIPVVVNGKLITIDTSKPNPNGIEFDNLYLDMNNIIHPCFHPEDQPPPKNYEEIFVEVFKYIDRIFAMIRPRKLLFMAIDGVAPRAKMNQQRSRRFRAAKDALDAAAEAEKLKGKFEAEGEKLAHSEQIKALDSNVITPGTEFMATLSSALQYYIHLRLSSDPGWRNIKVILSDANVPGEGEHKIMSYIRLQRNLPGFDPNTCHCLYGLDADLIMLALATHEVHFTILREDIRSLRKNEKNQKNYKVKGKGSKVIKQINVAEDDIPRMQFQFLHIWVLRDYLEHDLRIPQSPVKTDFERLIDDFVFMCLFVGNDFLPRMPSLEIYEGAIDLLMIVYKKEFARMGGYLTDSSEVDLKRVEHFIQVVGSHESAIFRRRGQLQKDRKKRSQEFAKHKLGKSSASARKSKKNTSKNFWSSLEQMGNPDGQPPKSDDGQCQGPANGLGNMVLNGSEFVDEAVDKVKLGEAGWKERYYAEKFDVKTANDYEQLREHAVLKYAEGICWVMHYYYQGVCSWQWFYPYHYAPFASDFYGLDEMDIHFTLGIPFKPFDQLMGVLPAASAHALPLFYRKLMTDALSPIADFYPADFELDMDGKRHSWQAICKLPFIKESRLLAEISKVEYTLTDQEKQRNSSGLDVLFVHLSHPLAAKALCSYSRKRDHPKLCKAKIKKKIDPKSSDGMNGFMYISDKISSFPETCSPVGSMESITKDKTISVFYKCPPVHPHIPRPPSGINMPSKMISEYDILPMPMLWHEKTAVLGRLFSERPVPKSISGPSLGKLAHQLVARYYLRKEENAGSIQGTNGSICNLNQTDSDKKANAGSTQGTNGSICSLNQTAGSIQGTNGSICNLNQTAGSIQGTNGSICNLNQTDSDKKANAGSAQGTNGSICNLNQTDSDKKANAGSTQGTNGSICNLNQTDSDKKANAVMDCMEVTHKKKYTHKKRKYLDNMVDDALPTHDANGSIGGANAMTGFTKVNTKKANAGSTQGTNGSICNLNQTDSDKKANAMMDCREVTHKKKYTHKKRKDLDDTIDDALPTHDANGSIGGANAMTDFTKVNTKKANAGSTQGTNGSICNLNQTDSDKKANAMMDSMEVTHKKRKYLDNTVDDALPTHDANGSISGANAMTGFTKVNTKKRRGMSGSDMGGSGGRKRRIMERKN